MKRLYVGTRKGVFSLEHDGGFRIAEASMVGVPVPTLLAHEGSPRVFAVADHGHFGNKLHVSDDGGRSWREGTAPAFPPKPADAPVVKDPGRGKEVPWSVEKIWCLEGGTSAQPTLWAGTIPGGLFRSDDGGATWRLIEALWNHPDRAKWFGGGYDFAGIHSIVVDPADASHVMVAISCGGVWRTRDGGASWQQTAHGMRADFMPPEQAYIPDSQDPHRVVGCQAHPTHLWAQHHNGIFRSVDHGASWQEITTAAPSAFGFAAAVHPSDPATAWFVPAQKDEFRVPVGGHMSVSRTRDGGATFETLRVGLPQHHAYHLVYRHGLAVDGSGNVLAMGSTTGGLWISEDGGDTWQCVTQDLPPIYCVRFG